MATRYVVLLNFAEKGTAAVTESMACAEAFRKDVAKEGASIDALFWTLGSYDGVFILNAPDESTATALVLAFGKRYNLRTCMLRAFDTEEFNRIVGKIE